MDEQLPENPRTTTDEELRQIVESHEQYMHERINAAYRAGVRKCLDILTGTNVAHDVAVKLMEAEMKRLYV